MILDVSHVTLYRYDLPVRGVVQSLRLTPSAHAGQKALSWQVTVSGGVLGPSFRDGGGDMVQGCAIRGPVSEIAVEVRGRVETSDTQGVLRNHREITPPEAYLRDTAATETDEALRALAAGAAGKDALDSAHRLADAVADAIAYTPGATQVQTSAREALAQAQGVCQDHAHALIAAARVLDLPARYVSGYLLADADGADHRAAHAWAEVFVAGLGWIGFDPANRCCPDARYVRLGSGLDAATAAPIRGSARGPSGAKLDVTVAVQSVQQ